MYWDARKGFSLLNHVLLMDLNRSSMWVGGGGLLFLPWLMSKTTCITLLFHYNDSHVRLEQLYLGPASKSQFSIFDSLNRLYMVLMKFNSFLYENCYVWVMMRRFIWIFIFYSFTIIICYWIYSHTKKIIFIYQAVF